MSATDALDPAWAQLYTRIQLQFPYSIVYGLRVKEGTVVSCERVQFTRVLTREMAQEDWDIPEALSEQWRRLIMIMSANSKSSVNEKS